MAQSSDILAKVEEFLLDDASVGDDFEKFAKENCQAFEEGDENKLVYTEIYQKFTDLFNQRVEDFIKKNGSTLEEFMKECEKADEDNFAVQLIMSITSFDAFKALMLEQKSKQ